MKYEPLHKLEREIYIYIYTSYHNKHQLSTTAQITDLQAQVITNIRFLQAAQSELHRFMQSSNNLRFHMLNCSKIHKKNYKKCYKKSEKLYDQIKE